MNDTEDYTGESDNSVFSAYERDAYDDDLSDADKAYIREFNSWLLRLVRSRKCGVNLFVIPCEDGFYTEGMAYGEDGVPYIDIYVCPSKMLFSRVLMHEYGHILQSVFRAMLWEINIAPHYVQGEYFADKFAILALERLRFRFADRCRKHSVDYVYRKIQDYLDHVEPPYLRFSRNAFSWVGKTAGDFGYSYESELRVYRRTLDRVSNYEKTDDEEDDIPF